MKKISDMTHDELIALTEENVDMMVKLQFAENGIQFAPKPPEPTGSVSPLRDTYFEIEGTGLIFRTRTAAEKVQAALISLTSDELCTLEYDWKVGYEWKYLKARAASLLIEQKQCYLKHSLDEKEAELIRIKSRKEAYETEVKEYENQAEQRQRIRNSIWDEWNDAKSRERKIINFQSIMEEYKQIACGDEALAIVFFEKAYKIEDEIIREKLGLAKLEKYQ